eukprot:gene10127-13618_t
MSINLPTIILIFTNIITLLTTLIQYCSKSRCSTIDLCCGAVHHIDRKPEEDDDIESQDNVNYENYKKISNKEMFKRYGQNPLSKKTRKKINDMRRSDSSGHWCVLVRNDTNIYYFDSYGVKPDGEMSHISFGLRYELHENQKSLSRLLKTIPKNFLFAYNKTQFQQYSPNINTCGKWSVVFTKCIFDGMTLDQFQQRMSAIKSRYNVSYDELVCVLFDSF